MKRGNSQPFRRLPVDPATSHDYQSNAAKLVELIRAAKFVMLTTRCTDGSLRSRPLTRLDVERDGSLWFIVQADSEVAREVEIDSSVNVAYTNADDGTFVAVAGHAQVIQDHAKAAELWSPAFKAWFSGPDDPNLALLRVSAEEADYWNSPSTRVGRLVGFVKALATGDDSALGARHRLQFGEADDTGRIEGGVHGEGNYAASRQYNDATAKFVQSGRVEKAADAAAPANATEAADLRRAEEIGKSHAKEEDPQVHRR
jgi:general stress protein 26